MQPPSIVDQLWVGRTRCAKRRKVGYVLDLDRVRRCIEKPGFLSASDLDVINRYFSEMVLEQGATRSEQDKKTVGRTYRSSRVGWLPKDAEYRWLCEKLGGVLNEANQALW